MLAREAFVLRRAIMYYAGAEALRQLSRVRDPDAGAADDRRNVNEDLSTLTHDGETFDLLRDLAKRRAVLLVKHRATARCAVCGASPP